VDASMSETRKYCAVIVDLDGTLYFQNPVRLCMAISILIFCITRPFRWKDIFLVRGYRKLYASGVNHSESCFRLAHIGYYYNKKTLEKLMVRTGFELKRYLPVRWCFTGAYIFERLGQYLSFLHGKRCPKIFKNLMVSITFGDSLLAVYSKQRIRKKGEKNYDKNGL
jgi:hypothetical protein